VRALIEEPSAALLNGAATSDSDAELPALLAYEARIDDVREWPFDTSNLLRFALFLLIPLASWLGGAARRAPRRAPRRRGILLASLS